MTRRVLEVERTYDVPDDLADDLELPDLGGLGAGTGLPEERQLEAVYWDTEDLRLRRGRATLRCRTGGPDAGWHLKLPSGADREEVQVDGVLADGVPEALVAAASGLLRGAPLTPLARLRTTRTVRVLRGASGELVEVVDDRVEAERLREPGSPVLRWREWEVELVAGHRDLLDAVEERLLAAGAVPAAMPSKLGRVVPLPAPVDRPWRDGRSGGAVLARALRASVDVLLAADAPLRDGAPGAVHRARVALRRVDGLLRTARPLLEQERTEPLRADVRREAATLAQARRPEVMTVRLRDLLAAEPPELVLGPVRDVLDEVLAADARGGRSQVLDTLGAPAHLSLLDALDALADDPPFTDRALRPADRELRRLLRRAVRRLASSAEDAEGPVGLEQVRRRAAAVRDLATASRDVVPGARRLARRARDLQDALGEVEDALAAQDVLRRAAALCARAGRNGFTFGRLHALEQLQEDEVLEVCPSLVRRVLRAVP